MVDTRLRNRSEVENKMTKLTWQKRGESDFACINGFMCVCMPVCAHNLRT